MRFERTGRGKPDWNYIRLHDGCSVITSGGTPSRKVASYFAEEGIPWVKTKELNDWKLFKTEEHISKEGLANSSAKLLPVGTVLMAMIGATVGKLGILGIEATCNQNSVAMVADEVSLSSDFLFYLLLNYREEIIGVATGGAQQALSGELVRSFEFQVPSISQQRLVAGVLSALDEKIAINQSIASTLEEMCQAIFKSWFIDFDPVQAKAVGERPAGMNDATAKLFPDSMEESELGAIPSGWIVCGLDEISEFLNGLAMQKFPVEDESAILPVIKIAQLRAGSTAGADIASGLLDPRYVIKDGDILFSWSGTLEVEIWAGGPGALNQHLFKVTGVTVPDWFSYLSTRHFLPTFREIASGKATTMGHIQRGHLSEAKIALPPRELLDSAQEILQPLLELKLATLVSNRTLVELRDSLLPRLVSGELSFPKETMAS
jgi:type I restriction enzyme S subunit